jgi:hypothetical protein
MVLLDDNLCREVELDRGVRVHSRDPELGCGPGYRLGVAETGVAPNAIELHPILRFRCLTG